MPDKVRLDLILLLPEMEAGDRCVQLLTDTLSHRKGITQAHIVRDDGTARLCLHYDPNLVDLPSVERLARDIGAEVTDRYRHERIPFTGLLTADAADVLGDALNQLPGMIHADVNYAAGLIFVAISALKFLTTHWLWSLRLDGAILQLILLGVSTIFWYGFALPYGLLLGIPQAILIVLAWSCFK